MQTKNLPWLLHEQSIQHDSFQRLKSCCEGRGGKGNVNKLPQPGVTCCVISSSKIMVSWSNNGPTHTHTHTKKKKNEKVTSKSLQNVARMGHLNNIFGRGSGNWKDQNSKN